MRSPSPRPPLLREYEPASLARLIARHRSERGWSTRHLAQLADISQSYVVALERAATHPARPGPTPTLDVVARLAHAFGLEVERLVADVLHPVGRHVLLVTDGPAVSALDASMAVAPDQVDRWVVAGKRIDRATIRARGGATIDVRRGTDGYLPAQIADALARELEALGPSVAGCALGLVFAETGAVLAEVDDPGTVLEFEQRWGAVTRRAAATAGARALCNVCVYSPSSIGSLADPVAAAVHLLEHHDDVWLHDGARLRTGARAARRLLLGLRPVGTAATAWRTTVDDLIHHLGLAA